MHCVVGSGPSGVACAQALIDRGAAVQMLDGGVDLEPARAERVASMRSAAPGEWSAADVAFLKEGVSSGVGGVAVKRVYGSDYPYQDAEAELGMTLSGVGVKPSLARGGFSNVWGAAMLPYASGDLQDWPFDVARLAPHYRAVTAMTGMSAVVDDLAQWLPVYADKLDSLRLSQQGASLLRHFEAHRAQLTDAGFSFGRSRLAVMGSAEAGHTGCVHCGLCMYGCPYGLIYRSMATVDRLREHARFSYRPDFIVEAVQESDSAATIVGRDRRTGAASTISCDRVYLAAGALPSTQIVLRSLGAFNRPVSMKDSQYFLIPILMSAGVRDVREEQLHSLCQLFLELRDTSISPYSMHLQVYTYNDLIGRAVESTLGPLHGMLGRLTHSLEGRLAVLQGYLHSAHSGRMRLELKRTGPNSAPWLSVHGEANPNAKRTIRRLLAKLLRHAGKLGALPLAPLVNITQPGRGFHTGGTFPMRTNPGEFECDVLGRPQGWQRVHVVDATILPSIAATTITLTVMANSHRIGWESSQL